MIKQKQAAVSNNMRCTFCWHHSAVVLCAIVCSVVATGWEPVESSAATTWKTWNVNGWFYTNFAFAVNSLSYYPLAPSVALPSGSYWQLTTNGHLILNDFNGAKIMEISLSQDFSHSLQRYDISSSYYFTPCTVQYTVVTVNLLYSQYKYVTAQVEFWDNGGIVIRYQSVGITVTASVTFFSNRCVKSFSPVSGMSYYFPPNNVRHAYGAAAENSVYSPYCWEYMATDGAVCGSTLWAGVVPCLGGRSCTFNFTADFNTTNGNPNGRYVYGVVPSYPPIDGRVMLLDTTYNNAYWYSSFFPAAYNVPHVMAGMVHPGCDSFPRAIVIGWRAFEMRHFTLSVSFTMGNTGTTEGSVYLNTTLLYRTVVTYSTQTFTTSGHVEPGWMLWVVVDRYGFCGSDGTYVNASIRLHSTETLSPSNTMSNTMDTMSAENSVTLSHTSDIGSMSTTTSHTVSSSSSQSAVGSHSRTVSQTPSQSPTIRLSPTSQLSHSLPTSSVSSSISPERTKSMISSTVSHSTARSATQSSTNSISIASEQHTLSDSLSPTRSSSRSERTTPRNSLSLDASITLSSSGSFSRPLSRSGTCTASNVSTATPSNSSNVTATSTASGSVSSSATVNASVTSTPTASNSVSSSATVSPSLSLSLTASEVETVTRPKTRSATIPLPVVVPAMSTAAVVAEVVGTGVAVASVASGGDVSNANILVLLSTIDCASGGGATLSVAAKAVSVFGTFGFVAMALTNLGLLFGVSALHLVVLWSAARWMYGGESWLAVSGERGYRFPLLSLLICELVVPQALFGALAALIAGGSVDGGTGAAAGVALLLIVGVVCCREVLLRLFVLPRISIHPYTHFSQPPADGAQGMVPVGVLGSLRASVDRLLRPSHYWEPAALRISMGLLFTRQRSAWYVGVSGLELWLALLTSALVVVASAFPGGGCRGASLVLSAVYGVVAVAMRVTRLYRLPLDNAVVPVNYACFSAVCLLKAVSGYFDGTAAQGPLQVSAEVLQVLQSVTLVLKVLGGGYMMWRERLYYDVERTALLTIVPVEEELDVLVDDASDETSEAQEIEANVEDVPVSIDESFLLSHRELKPTELRERRPRAQSHMDLSLLSFLTYPQVNANAESFDLPDVGNTDEDVACDDLLSLSLAALPSTVSIRRSYTAKADRSKARRAGTSSTEKRSGTSNYSRNSTTQGQRDGRFDIGAFFSF